MNNKFSEEKSAPFPMPEIQPHFAYPILSDALQRHVERGKGVVQNILPKEFFSLSPKEAGRWLSTHLPLVSWNAVVNTPDFITIYFLGSSNHEIRAEKVLLDVIRKWLIPEKEVHILGFQNMYFYMREISDQLFFTAEVKVLVENGQEMSLIQEHLPFLANELSLSLSSAAYFEHTLDTKALSLDQKSAQIQQYLRRLIQKFPAHFDVGVFREMSTFLALSKPEFRQFRQPKQLTRVIVSHYMMRKKLLHEASISPDKRRLEFKIISSKLHFPFGTKAVLGISVSVGLRDRYEIFEDSHIVNSVQKLIPEAQMVKGSFYFYRVNQDSIKNVYLELEKKDGSSFKLEERNLLKKELKEQLKNRIERLIPSVFMIRNEEEIMRNILLLSQELKLLSDLPQVMVNFDKQSVNELYFTILVVRVLKPNDLPLEKCFQKVKQPCRFLPDRIQAVGYVRKKTPKEANVFHLCIPKEPSILRADSSVNFYLGRQKVISIIIEALGEVRDYNGGMILKQGELFAQFKQSFEGIAERNPELLENFFFSLNPIEAQATSSLSNLEILFTLFLEATQVDLLKRESYFQNMKKQGGVIFAVLSAKDPSLEAVMNEELNHLENFSRSLIRTQVNFQGVFVQGFIYEIADSLQQEQFEALWKKGIQNWVSGVIHQQELRLGFAILPPYMDPRVGGDEVTSSLIKMLFEGLTRISRDSKPSLALAKSIEISADQKQYIFKLRPSYWSDQTPLIAYDFEYAWKTILSPAFSTPFAYFFYPIKNAKAAKDGIVPLDKVGIKATDENTLVVELEHPAPEFLELTAHALYSPVQSRVDQLHPNWAQESEEFYFCNGPFKMKKVFPNGGYEFIKNPFYWDKDSVKLDRIVILKNNVQTLHEMYKKDEICWIGRPMYNWEPYFSQEKDKKVVLKKASGVQWCVFNAQRFPFNHTKLRQALSYAIDQQKIVDEMPNSEILAFSPMPLIHSQYQDKKQTRYNPELSKKLFQESLNELGLNKGKFPVFTLIYSGAILRKKTAEMLVQQWEEALGISCRLEAYDFHIVFSKMARGDYQLGMINWKAWINDPTYTLNAFRYQNSRVNFAKWEHPKFQEVLDLAQLEGMHEKRFDYFKKAENILLKECPVIPLYHEPHQYMHKSYLKDAFCSEMGNVDFKWASIARE